MYGNERLGVIRRTFQSRQRAGIPEISQGHANIAQKAASFGPDSGCAVEALFESGFIQGEEFQKIRSGEAGSGVFAHQAAFAGEAVPRADGEAIVAAVNAIA